ncbi:hypothetical protein [Sulfurimonas microaerophilic]|uniref:hypothetical protein n=1 Tax=Sulfurimonas microaerophilic TaxID=3058392 RepID=UPI00271465BB|nr:hypothetical protein [Sulfurimonas sp. hsl 1-7]
MLGITLMYVVVKLNFYAFKYHNIDLNKEDRAYRRRNMLVTFGSIAGILTSYGFTEGIVNYLYNEVNPVFSPFFMLFHFLVGAGVAIEAMGTFLLFSWIFERFSCSLPNVLVVWLVYLNFVFKKAYKVIRKYYLIIFN